MKGSIAVLAVVAWTALALAGSAAAAVQIGVVDDHVRGPEPTRFLDRMSDVGLSEVRVTVSWDPAAPTTIREQQDIAQMLPFAQARGIRVIIAIDLASPRAIGNSAAAAGRFAAFTGQVARAFPTVKDIIVGNEPNQTRFWQPQYNGNGTPAACVAYERTLAASYDVLKQVDPAINVIGVGLSPRGNDNPKAKDNVSRSPVRCLRDIGAAYRGSARRKPIMNEFSFHPYPNSNRDPYSKGYQWPNAGVPNLNRIKQAFWDAFRGTGQPLFTERTSGGLKFRLDEVGWQVGVVPASAHAYQGRENVPTTDERLQAAQYGGLISYLACDPSVRSVLFFGIIDEPALERWQAGLLRADGSERPAYGVVKNTFAQTHGHCTGRMRTWKHTQTVVGTRSFFPRIGRPLSLTNRAWSFKVRAEETANYRAGVFRLKSPSRVDRKGITRSLAGTGGALRKTGVVKAYWTPKVKLPARTLKAGWYVYGVRLAADVNAKRTKTFVGRPFRVGSR
jgi:hypothetical protein